MSESRTARLTALSLFSGIGGLCEGVKLGGFKVVGAVERDCFAAENYRLNFPEIPLFEGDIANFLADGPGHTKQLSDFVPGGKVDLIFGGPPCQGYSQIGPRDEADPRNELYLHLCRLATLLKPSFILIENVPNMLLMKGGMFKHRVMKALTASGYENIGLLVLDASEFGVPQRRKRVFFIASSSQLIPFPLQDVFEASAASLRLPHEVSVDDAISDLPAAVAADSGVTVPYPAWRRHFSDFQREMRVDQDGNVYAASEKARKYRCHFSEVELHNHHTKDIQQRRLNLIRLLKPGMKADSLPKDIWDCARPEKWRRFDGSKPAHTLMAQMHRDLSEWVHPSLDRWITVREAMRLQTFHDGFILHGSEWQQLKQVGNAVPPLLGRIPALALQAANALANGLPMPFKLRASLGVFGPQFQQEDLLLQNNRSQTK